MKKNRYLYRVRSNFEPIAVEMALGEKLEREISGGFLILPDGREARIDFEADLKKDGLSTKRRASRRASRAKWPMTSVNAGVNPEQIQELRSFWEERGIIGCDVKPDGDVVWNDAAARKRDCESRGLYDRNGGYGDPQPHNM